MLLLSVLLACQAAAQVAIPELGSRGGVPAGLTSTFTAQLRRAVASAGLAVSEAELVTQGIAGSLDPELAMLIAWMEGTRYAVSGEISVAPGAGQPFSVALLVVDERDGRASDLISRHFSLESLALVTRELAAEIAAFTDRTAALPAGDAGLFVSSDPSGAEVYLNGLLVGITGELGLLDLAPGRYSLELRLDGYMPATRSLELRQGVPSFPHLTLTAVSGGSVQLGSVPRAEVLAAGVSLGFTPLMIPAHAGVLQLTLVREGFRSQEISVIVRNNRVSRSQVMLQPEREPLVFWTPADGVSVSINGEPFSGAAATSLRPGRVEIAVTDSAGTREYTAVLPLTGAFELDLQTGALVPLANP